MHLLRSGNVTLLTLPALMAGLAGFTGRLAAQQRFFPDVPSFELPVASPRVNGFAGRIIKTSRADNLFGKEKEADVAIGEDFPVFLLRGGPRPVTLGFGVEVYGRFSLDDPKTSMISTDWQVGFNVHADLRPWELALQLYHESSHLGDEYADRFGASRIDWTREVLTAWAGYHAGRFRIMGSGSYVPIDELKLSRWAGSLGVDYRGAGFRLLGQTMHPIAGLYGEGASATDWRISTSAKAGLALPGGKPGREFTLSIVAHDGLS
ncbi:MAG: DUF1207 domain-containing protein, partial [Gemmatimonadales bacterium]